MWWVQLWKVLIVLWRIVPWRWQLVSKSWICHVLVISLKGRRIYYIKLLVLKMLLLFVGLISCFCLRSSWLKSTIWFCPKKRCFGNKSIELNGLLHVIGILNSIFFHLSILSMRNRKRIQMLKNDAGIWIDDHNLLKHIALDYLRSLYSIDDSSRVALSFMKRW